MQHDFDKEDKAQVDVEKELSELRKMSAAQSEALKFVLKELEDIVEEDKKM